LGLSLLKNLRIRTAEVLKMALIMKPEIPCLLAGLSSVEVNRLFSSNRQKMARNRQRMLDLIKIVRKG
jgi:hypothetical protein